MADSPFKKHEGAGVCDVCNASVGPNEANLVPVDTLYGSPKYRKHLQRDPMFVMMGGGDVDAHLKTMRMMDPTEYSAVCDDCVSLFIT